MTTQLFHPFIFKVVSPIIAPPPWLDLMAPPFLSTILHLPHSVTPTAFWYDDNYCLSKVTVYPYLVINHESVTCSNWQVRTLLMSYESYFTRCPRAVFHQSGISWNLCIALSETRFCQLHTGGTFSSTWEFRCSRQGRQGESLSGGLNGNAGGLRMNLTMEK